MQKHDIVPLIVPLPKDADLAPLERIAEIGYRRHYFEPKFQSSNPAQIELYVRNNYSPASLVSQYPKGGFAAVFKKGEGIDFLVTYDVPSGVVNVEEFARDLKEIESKVLRQKFFSWPPRFLRKDKMAKNFLVYSSLLFFAAVGAASLYILSNHKQFEGYMRELLKDKDEARLMIETIPLSILSGFLAMTYAVKYAGTYLGSLADRLRTKKMSGKVTDYQFGNDALKGLQRDLDKKDFESSAIDLFKEARLRNPPTFYEKFVDYLKRFGTKPLP